MELSMHHHTLESFYNILNVNFFESQEKAMMFPKTLQDSSNNIYVLKLWKTKTDDIYPESYYLSLKFNFKTPNGLGYDSEVLKLQLFSDTIEDPDDIIFKDYDIKPGEYVVLKPSEWKKFFEQISTNMLENAEFSLEELKNEMHNTGMKLQVLEGQEN